MNVPHGSGSFFFPLDATTQIAVRRLGKNPLSSR